MLPLGSAPPGNRPLRRASKFPLVRRARGRRGVGRVDHDVDPDRRLLRLDELRQPELVGRVRASAGARSGSRSPTRRRASSRAWGRTACTGPSSRRTRRCSPARSGCSSACMRPPKTTLFSALRSIASSNACRSFALEASGVPTFVYGRLPTPFLLPMLMTMPCQPSWWRLDHPQARGLPDARELRRRDPVEHLDVARLQRRRRRGRVGHRLEDDLVEVDVLLVVVVGRLDHGDVVADDAVVEHERADADRVRRRSCRRAWPAASARGRTGCR